MNWNNDRDSSSARHRHLDGETRRIVDEIVERFEEAWSRGDRLKIGDLLPADQVARRKVLIELVHCELELRIEHEPSFRIEDCLREHAELAEDEQVVLDLIETEYTLRRRKGDGVTIDEYIRRFPAMAELLSGRLAAESTRSELASSAIPSAAEFLDSPIGFDGLLSPPFRVAKFDVVEIVGEGSFGTVFRAHDSELDRIVALKTPRQHLGASREDEVRFLREASSSAQLSHPGIVHVYDVLQEGNRPYIVSEFVSGKTLAEVSGGEVLEFRLTATILMQVAEALQHAHEKGVIHRDLKPSNIILDDKHEPARPRLMDFGLARREDGNATMTRDGQILGTPAYMSPEQACGKSGRVDPRSDLFSVGVILYQLLTGELPFRGAIRMLLIQIEHEDPRAPRKLNDQVPRDLETICLKCLEKSTDRRYRSASELADDLRRFLNGEPVEAKPVSRANRIGRWCKRNPRLAGLSAVSVILVFCVIVLTWSSASFHRSAYERERRVRRAVEQNLYYSSIHQAALEYRNNQLAGVETALDQAAPASAQHDLRGWEWYFLKGLLKNYVWEDEVGVEGAEWVTALKFSPDGRWLAAGAGVPRYLDRTSTTAASLKVWKAETGEVVLDLSGETLSVADLAFDPAGKRIAIVQQDRYFRPLVTGKKIPGTVRIWDLESGREFRKLKANEGVFERVVFSPNGRFIAADSAAGLRIWSAETGAVICDIEDVTLWEFRSDENQVLVVGRQGKLKVLAIDRSELLETIGEVPPGIREPGGRLTATVVDKLGSLQVWDVATRKIRALIPHDGKLGFAFRPDGRMLAHGAAHGTVHLWDLDDNREAVVFRGHRAHVQRVAFSPDGRRLASGDWMGHVLVWDATRHPEYTVLGTAGKLNRPNEAVAFLEGGGRLIALRKRMEQLTTWDVDSGRPVSKHDIPVTFERRSPARLAALSANGRRLAAVAAEDDRQIVTWDTASGKKLAQFTGHTLPVQFVVFGKSGPLVASAAWDWKPKDGKSATVAEICVWDARDGRQWYRFQKSGSRVFRLALGSRRKLLAAALVRFDRRGKTANDSEKYEVHVWDLQSRREVLTNHTHRSRILGLAMSRDERFVASASFDDGIVQYWDVDSGKIVWQAESGQAEIEDLAISPTGRRLAGVTRRNVVLWDAATGHRVLALTAKTPPGSPIFNPQVVFSADGKQIAATQHDDTVAVWRTEGHAAE